MQSVFCGGEAGDKRVSESRRMKSKTHFEGGADDHLLKEEVPKEGGGIG